MKVSVLGLGYVGLPLAAAIARKTNNEVVGYDPQKSKIEKISRKECPIDDEQCALDLKEIDLNISNDETIIKDSDIYIVCVPTPVLDDFTPDLNPVRSAVRTVSKYISKGQILIIESTINPGVCDEIVIPLVERETGMKAGVDFDVAHCPERINPGDPNWNVYNIPRNLGSTSPEATKKAADLYREFISAEINEMKDLKTTEATKIIENTFRDINIAFVNELAKSFDVLDIDLTEVIRGASNKPFAFMAHYPSCGVGGHCIPVDPYYLIDRAGKSGFDHKFLKLAREINNSMPEYTIELLADALNEKEKSVKNTKIALLGLSYKADVGDIRESPSIKLIELLQTKKADFQTYDPYFTDMSTAKGIGDALDFAYALVVATDHKAFKQTLTGEYLKKNNIEVVIDGKNCLDKNDIESFGIIYKGIGK
jgi:nucleotide sugar dehydrogenase